MMPPDLTGIERATLWRKAQADQCEAATNDLAVNLWNALQSARRLAGMTGDAEVEQLGDHLDALLDRHRAERLAVR